MGLLKYIVRRLLMLVPTLIGIALIVFALIQMLPLNRRAMLYIQDPRTIRNIPEIIRRYGLDQPVHMQFVIWLGEVFRGNLGWSETCQAPVVHAILTRLPATLELVLYSAPIILLLGTYLGVKSAEKHGKPIDHASRTMGLVSWALPSFWFAILLLGFFYAYLGWFPPGRNGNEVLFYVTAPDWRAYTGLVTIDSLLNGQLWIFVDALRHLVLPVVVLVASNIVIIMKVMRSSTLEILKKKVQVAIAMEKGSIQNEVIGNHMQNNVLFPAITLLGLLFAGMLTSLILTETVFNFPGVGWLIANAAIRLDIATVIGFVLLAGFFFAVVNLIVDIACACVDPRIR